MKVLDNHIRRIVQEETRKPRWIQIPVIEPHPDNHSALAEEFRQILRLGNQGINHAP